MFETPHGIFQLRNADRKKEVPLYSLYGAEREPHSEHLRNVDTIVVDLPDIGCRVYTYMTTLAGCLKQAAKLKKRVVVLDRPNPIGLFYRDRSHNNRFHRVEGNIMGPQFPSFVGWFEIPMRHGLTLGELGKFYIQSQNLDVDFEVVTVQGISRNTAVRELSLSLPRMASPNMPSSRTMTFFPISVLLEGTNISEGRGTVSPFQAIGAPFLDEDELYLKIGECFKRLKVDPEIYWRTHQFLPLFDKYSGQICKGIFLDSASIEIGSIFSSGIVLLAALCMAGRESFQWRAKGYEYNFEQTPIDLILGQAEWRDCFEKLRCGVSEESTFSSLRDLLQRSSAEAQEFASDSAAFSLYS